MKANFICPFDMKARITTGESLVEGTRSTAPSGHGTVVVQVRADWVAIELLKI